MSALRLSPLSKLYAKIRAEMAANGTPFTDAAAEVEFRTWLNTAWIASGCTQEFSCLYQPLGSMEVSIGVRGQSGSEVNVWWGDSTSSQYMMTGGTVVPITKTYATSAKRLVVVIGNCTRIECGATTLGGRLFSNTRSLEEVTCWGAANIAADIASPNPKMWYLSCFSSAGVHGDLNDAPCDLVYLVGNGCPFTYSGGRVWANGMRYIAVEVPIAGLWTSAMTDSFLIDVAASTWVGEKQVFLVGHCGSPTPAADDAIDSLIAQGVSVNTN